MNLEADKQLVQDFWDEASCGEKLYMKGDSRKEQFENQMKERYRIEPEILEFADFPSFKGKRTLEVGVGLGSDHQMLAQSGADLYGIDLTPRAIKNTKERLEIFGLKSNLQVADAENLPFDDEEFEAVYSWGVILASPSPEKAADEIYRVLKPGGLAKVMIYKRKSMVGYMLWIRYALMRLRPFTSLDEIYAKYLESPGTNVYSVEEAREMFGKFSDVEITTTLTHGDLLTSKAGQRHEGFWLGLARKVYPRALVRRFFKNHGLFMMIKAIK